MRSYLIVFFLLILNSFGFSQLCLTGGTTFTLQSEIDSFQINYPGCIIINGDVTIQGSDISNLDSLIVLNNIYGDLNIGQIFSPAETLVSIQGLQNLESVEENLNIEFAQSLPSLDGLQGLLSIWGSIRIANNPLIKDLSPLSNITGLGYDIEIIDNDSLEYIQAFQYLESLPHDLWINQNPLLKNLQGLEGLNYINGFLFIGGTKKLQDLSELSSLTMVGEGMNIFDNDSLTSLTGLENLTSINSADVFAPFLSIQMNGTLENIEALSNLSEIGGAVWINNNPMITRLNGLENINASSISELIISGNELLYHCSVEGICNYLASDDAIVIIENNASQCNSNEEVESICEQTECFENGIVFNHQIQIDNFSNDFPDCTEIIGDIIIHGMDIENFNGLSILTSIGGNLQIFNNPILNDVSGFSNLLNIEGHIKIWQNDLLIDFQGFENIQSIGDYLNINSNPLLESLNGLQNIDPLSITDLIIFNNPSLSYCRIENVCEYLLDSNGLVLIYDNNEDCNSAIEVIDQCEIQGCLIDGISFTSQSQIDDFQNDYPFCNSILGDVNISGEDIINLNGLSQIEMIQGGLWIHSNPMLENLEGINYLESIEGLLYIGHNDVLSNLSGLENLNQIGDYLKINSNEILNDISYIQNLDYIGGGLYLFFNPLLSDCAIESVCNYLNSPNGIINIHSNGSLCNSIENVELSCIPLSVNENKKFEVINFYPNPADDILHISCSEMESLNELRIFNQVGKQVYFSSAFDSPLDISSLLPGVYIIQIIIENGMVSKKLIIE